MKNRECKENWIKETRMFQRIAGIKETPYEILAADWDSMKLKTRRFELALY